MIVVSDTTPLISLMKIGHLELLKKYFGEVQIPEAVFNELTVNERFTLIHSHLIFKLRIKWLFSYPFFYIAILTPCRVAINFSWKGGTVMYSQAYGAFMRERGVKRWRKATQ